MSLNVGDILYDDPLLTNDSGNVAVNYGPFGGGWGWIYLTDTCPISSTIYLVQLRSNGEILDIQTC